MPAKPLRPCQQHGCRNLTTGLYCDQHKRIDKPDRKAQSTYYDHHQRDQAAKAFYNSAAWIAVRCLVLERDRYMCQPCLRMGRHRPATTVHHKRELRNNPEAALDPENLEGICIQCHNQQR